MRSSQATNRSRNRIILSSTKTEMTSLKFTIRFDQTNSIKKFKSVLVNTNGEMLEFEFSVGKDACYYGKNHR